MITGPIHSFYVRTPYALKYNFKSHSIFLNDKELNSRTFSSEYKIIKEIYRKLVQREECKKFITTRLTSISNSVKTTDSDFLSSSEEKRTRTKRKSSHKQDGSSSESSGCSSTSRDRESGD